MTSGAVEPATNYHIVTSRSFHCLVQEHLTRNGSGAVDHTVAAVAAAVTSRGSSDGGGGHGGGGCAVAVFAGLAAVGPAGRL